MVNFRRLYGTFYGWVAIRVAICPEIGPMRPSGGPRRARGPRQVGVLDARRTKTRLQRAYSGPAQARAPLTPISQPLSAPDLPAFGWRLDACLLELEKLYQARPRLPDALAQTEAGRQIDELLERHLLNRNLALHAKKVMEQDRAF